MIQCTTDLTISEILNLNKGGAQLFEALLTAGRLLATDSASSSQVVNKNHEYVTNSIGQPHGSHQSGGAPPLQK